MDLTQPSDLRTLLDRHGVTADKRLGQHFLVSSRVVDAITGALGPALGMLEVGPGPGVLTRALTGRGLTVIAVEKDRTMAPVLAESAPNAHIVLADALRHDLAGLVSELPIPRAVVSNMPYNITGPLLERFADLRDLVSRMVLMMQREVGERVLAPPGDRRRGAVSVDLQHRFGIEKVCDAPAGVFWPPPKVDSVVLAFQPTTGRIEDAGGVRALAHLGFRQPRKTLANNLAAGLGLDRDRVRAVLEAIGIPPDARPAVPSVTEWVALRRALT